MCKLLNCLSMCNPQTRREKCLTWRCFGGFGGLPFCRRADKPAVRAALCDRNKQSPVSFASEISLTSILPIRATIHLIVLKQWDKNRYDIFQIPKTYKELVRKKCCHSPIQSQPIHQSFLQGPPATGWPHKLWCLSWTPPPPWTPPPEAHEMCWDFGSEWRSALCGSLSLVVHEIQYLAWSWCVSPLFCLDLQRGMEDGEFHS